MGTIKSKECLCAVQHAEVVKKIGLVETRMQLYLRKESHETPVMSSWSNDNDAGSKT